MAMAQCFRSVTVEQQRLSMLSGGVASLDWLRERGRGTVTHVVDPLTADAGRALLASCGLALRDGLEPVSYTHLTLPTICSV